MEIKKSCGRMGQNGQGVFYDWYSSTRGKSLEKFRTPLLKKLKNDRCSSTFPDNYNLSYIKENSKWGLTTYNLCKAVSPWKA